MSVKYSDVVVSTAVNGQITTGSKSGPDWKQTAAYVLAAGLIAVGAMYGVRRWRHAKIKRLEDMKVALMDAIRDGDSVTTTKLLISREIDVNTPISGELPLFVAVYNGDPDIVSSLVHAGVKLDATSGGDTTALMAACTLGRTDMAKILLAAGADAKLVDEAGFTAAHMAAKTGNLDCLRALGTYDPDTISFPRRSDGATPLMLAAAEGHTSVVQWVCSRPGVEVNAQMLSGITALGAAVKDDHFQAASVLLQHGADPNLSGTDGRTALSIAVQHNSRRSVEGLLRAGAVVDNAAAADDVRPMLIAARKANCDMLQTLVSHGGDPNMILQDGRSLLLAAVDGLPVKKGKNTEFVVRPQVIEALLELGADPHFLSQERASDDRRDSYVARRTPYAAARAGQDEEVIRIFEDRLSVAGGEP